MNICHVNIVLFSPHKLSNLVYNTTKHFITSKYIIKKHLNRILKDGIPYLKNIANYDFQQHKLARPTISLTITKTVAV